MLKNLTNQQLIDFIAKGDGVVLDVRTIEEYAQLGHIPEAVNIPIQELQARVGELDKKRPLVVICEHGVRSYDSAMWLISQGYTVFNHECGMADWEAQRAFGSSNLPSPSSLSSPQ